MGQKKGYKQTPEHIAARIRSGPDHHAWAGDSVSEKGGRSRALRKFREIPPCILCGSPRSERHHKDGNTRNNSDDNIAPLCRKCHMSTDGRMDRLIEGSHAAVAKATIAAKTKKLSRTHCKRGHEFSPGNTYRNAGRRICRECSRLTSDERKS